MNACCQHQGCVAVSQVMEADAQPCTPGYSSKVVTEHARIDGSPIVVGKHEVIEGEPRYLADPSGTMRLAMYGIHQISSIVA